MVANRRPNIDAFDSGLRRRIAIIECAPALPEGDRDPKLGEKLRCETSGILNWMLAGWTALQKAGLSMPSTIQNETMQYFNDKNEVAGFLSECLEMVPGEETPLADLYAGYCNWCMLESLEPRKQRDFSHLLHTVYEVEKGRSGSV